MPLSTLSINSRNIEGVVVNPNGETFNSSNLILAENAVVCLDLSPILTDTTHLANQDN